MDHLPAELPLVLGAGLNLLAAGIFATAALHKIRTFTEFTGFVAGYRLLPALLIRPGSAITVLLEVTATAGALITAPPLAYLPATMLLVYALAMSINLIRGRTNIDCGCGGTPMPLSIALVLRNLILAFAFFWAAGTGSLLEFVAARSELFPIAAGFALSLGICYAAFNQLQANRGILQRLWMQSA